jgi:hypothetical protein
LKIHSCQIWTAVMCPDLRSFSDTESELTLHDEKDDKVDWIKVSSSDSM